MPVQPKSSLSVYVLNVGEADTIIIRTPAGRIGVIDAVAPSKLSAFLASLGMVSGTDSIETMVITHPHFDHCSAAGKLLTDYTVNSVVMAPFWHREGWGSGGTYRSIIRLIEERAIPVTFLAGYSRIYMEDLDPDSGDDTQAGVPCLELLGPPNSLVERLDRADGYNANFLSIISRVKWNGFSMVLAADAQMENWAAFDSEGMLDEPCDVLKAAHHGSKNGTQWERLQRLRPEYVIVSSYADGRHDIPDLVGCSVFKSFREEKSDPADRPLVAMTENVGTVEVEASPGGNYEVHSYRELRGSEILESDRTPLTRSDTSTDWDRLIRIRLGLP